MVGCAGAKEMQVLPAAGAPSEQLPLVGVGGKSVDRMDHAADRNFFAEQTDMLGPIDDLPRNRAGGGKSDEDDR